MIHEGTSSSYGGHEHPLLPVAGSLPGVDMHTTQARLASGTALVSLRMLVSDLTRPAYEAPSDFRPAATRFWVAGGYRGFSDQGIGGCAMCLGFSCKPEFDLVDYDILFDPWLRPGESLVEAEANTDSPDLPLEAVAVEAAENAVKVWVSGGKARHSYRVFLTITTDQGRIKPVYFSLRVLGC